MDQPWLNFPPEDPRSQIHNWSLPIGALAHVYVGPPVGDSASASYGGASGQTPYVGNSTEIATQYPASGDPTAYNVIPPDPVGYGGYDPLSSAYPTPAPATLPGTPAGTYTGAAEFSYVPPAPTGYATEPVGDNFALSDEAVRRFGEYEAYLAGAGATPGLPGTPTDVYRGAAEFSAPVPATAPVGGELPPLTTSTLPAGGAMTALGSPALEAVAGPYGGGGGGYDSGGYGGSSGGGGYPYPAIPSFGNGSGAPRQMAPDGRFDPFMWSGTPNPMPPAGPMRSQILANLGVPGPPWAMGGPVPQTQSAPPPINLGPSPADQKKMILDSMKIGAEIAAAQQGPRPMSGLDYVAHRLKLDPRGGY